MATYYIDPSAGVNGTGTQLSPFNTWASVTWAAGNSYLQKAGTTASETLTVGASGTAGNLITVGTYGGTDNAIIDGANTRASGIISGNRDYVTIEYLTSIRNTSYGLNYYGSNLTFNNLVAYSNSVGFFTNTGVKNIADITFNDCEAYSNTSRGWQHVLQGAYSTTRLTLNNCVGRNNTTDGAIIGQSGGSPTATCIDTKVIGGEFYGNANVGLYFVNSVAGTYNNVNTLAQNVSSYSNGVCGIYVQGTTASKVIGCKTYSNGTLGTLGGIWTGNNASLSILHNSSYLNVSTTIDGAGIFDDQLNDGTKCIGNYVWGNSGGSDPESGFGIALFNARNSFHSGNVLFGNRHGYFWGHASSTNIKIYNCTVANSTVSNIRCFGGASATPSGEVTVKNVISLNPGTYHVYRPTANTYTYNYNSYYPVSGSQFYTDAGAVSYATWQGGGNDANSITSDPLLDANYRPTASSPCIGAGTYIAGTRYYRGETVRGTPDIGAMKYHTPRTIDSTRSL